MTGFLVMNGRSFVQRLDLYGDVIPITVRESVRVDAIEGYHAETPAYGFWDLF
jgi:hypothetical protein